MGNKTWKVLGVIGLYAVLAWNSPVTAKAAEIEVETSTTLYAKIDAPDVVVRKAKNAGGEAVTKVSRGQTYEVAAPADGGWIKISTAEGEGYIPSNRATLIEKTKEKVDESVKLRQDVVNYALQFVGNRYVYGGTDPNTGADCSGFTRYIMQHAAGVSLSHSSRAQSGEGRSVSYSEIKPGDLIFYGGKGYINHVAMYIGNGQIVHASTERTGIKVSNATYRTPVKVVRVLN